MSPEAPQSGVPIPVETERILIPDDQVTPEMHANAIGSPDRVGAGVLQQPEMGQGPENPVELGAAPVAAEVRVIDSEPSVQSEVNEHRISGDERRKLIEEVRAREAQAFNPEDAAVREPVTGEDIARKRGGEYPTQDQLDSINANRVAGNHIS